MSFHAVTRDRGGNRLLLPSEALSSEAQGLQWPVQTVGGWRDGSTLSWVPGSLVTCAMPTEPLCTE